MPMSLQNVKDCALDWLLHKCDGICIERRPEGKSIKPIPQEKGVLSEKILFVEWVILVKDWLL